MLIHSTRQNKKNSATTEKLSTKPEAEKPDKAKTPTDRWDPTQSFASLIQRDSKGHYELDGVRWDFNPEAPGSKTWKADFSQAKIDINGVKDVFVGVVPFMDDKIGHALLVFEFEDGSEVVNEKGDKEKRLVLSVDARMKEGEAWSLGKGLKREYPLVYQMDTFNARAKRNLRQYGERIILHKLDRTHEQKKELLKNTLDEAVSPKPNYHSTRNSCWTNVIDLLNSSADKGDKIRKKSLLSGALLQKIPVINPVFAGSLLAASGAKSDEPSIVIQPDKKLHPDKQVDENPNPLLKKLTKSSLWTPACTVAAGVALGALGHWLGGVAPAVFGTLLGATAGRVIGNESKIRANYVYASADQYIKD